VTTTTTNGHLATGGLERLRFFPRQLISADDLIQEQRYHRQKLRNHNRFLHGWGVVCGCDVQPPTSDARPWEIRICPGYVLTPQGDEILVPTEAVFDVATCVLSSEDPCAIARPCPPIGRRALETRKVYLAVRYRECESRPVRAAPVGCSCDDVECEYSRIRDGYEFCCLAELPKSHTPPPYDCADLYDPHGLLACGPGSDDPWVVLATITLPQVETERITQIDLVRDRRLLYASRALQELALCSAPRRTGAWHSVASPVFHNNPECDTGNNIEPENLRPGTGGKRLCEECARLSANS
jgi:hypothetical protein